MKKYNVINLIDYFSLLKEKKILQRNEAITSHIFVSFLYEKLKVKPFELYPQGHSKRGPVDYAFMPKENDILVIVEIKPYGSIKTLNNIENKMNQLKAYMKKTPNELKKIERINSWTIGIITDLINIKIVFRKTKWGNKTSEYYIMKEPFSNFLDLLKSSEIKSIFNNQLNNKYLSNKLWKDQINRYKAIFELYNKYESDFKDIRDKWKRNLPKNFSKGSINKVFRKTIQLLFDSSDEKQRIYLNKNPKYNVSLDTLKKTINKPICKKYIRMKVEEYFELILPKNTKLINMN